MLCSLLLVLAALAPPSPPGPTPAIKFPDVAPTDDKKPLPVVDPSASVVLNGDEQYIGESEVEPMVGVYPAGRLKVEVVPGPLRVKGKFAGGGGKTETKLFTGKFIIIIEAVGKGEATFVGVPPGAMKRSEWVERSIAANTAPQPPPDDGKKDVIPDPKPKPPPIDPDPKPQPDLVDGPVWLVTVTGPERTIAAAKLVNDTLFWVGLEKSAGHKFRHYAPGEKSAIDAGYAKIHAALGDCLIVVKPDPDGKTGKLVKKVKLPATTAEVSAILKATVK